MLFFMQLPLCHYVPVLRALLCLLCALDAPLHVPLCLLLHASFFFWMLLCMLLFMFLFVFFFMLLLVMFPFVFSSACSSCACSASTCSLSSSVKSSRSILDIPRLNPRVQCLDVVHTRLLLRRQYTHSLGV